MECERSALRISDTMNLAGEAASRTAKRLFASSPLCAAGRYMAPDHRGVDAVKSIVGQGLGKRYRYRLPYTAPAPTAKTAPNAVPTTVTLRYISPRCARAQAPQNAVHCRPPICGWTALPPLNWWQKLLQHMPFPFAQIPAAQGYLPNSTVLN